MSHSSGYKFDRVVFKTPREQINALITELGAIRDELDYHRNDAKKWSIQAMQLWQPIETSPKQKDSHCLLFGDGSSFKECAFVGYWDGYCWRDMPKYEAASPTHWMPLPPAPKLGADKTGDV